MFKNLFKKTDPKRRRVGVAAAVGILGGIFSAIVKFGWEVPFPPRTPERNATNPPQMLLQQLGMTSDQVHTTVSFNGNDNLPIYSFIIHFSFAIIFALFYCIVAEYFPGIKLWQGAAFGLLVWIGFHLILMPLMGTVPSPFPWVALLRGLGARRMVVVDRNRSSRYSQSNHTRARCRGSSSRSNPLIITFEGV